MPQSLTDDKDTFLSKTYKCTNTKSKVLLITNKYTTQSKVLQKKPINTTTTTKAFQKKQTTNN